jgi:hypothetical protein
MHGQKKRRKRSMAGEFEIDGLALAWELVSEPQSTTDGVKGLCVSVRLAEGARRELTIEYPYDPRAFFPQRPKLTAAAVEAETRAAMAQGWNPESRGRAAYFMATTALELGQQPAGARSYFPAPNAERSGK